MSVRCFLAIELPELVKDALCQLKRELATVTSGVKWVERHNLHLTLRFFGNLECDQIERLTVALRPDIAGIKPFTLVVEGVGAFPSSHRPRVLWVGVSGAAMPRLAELFARVETKASSLGLPAEARGLIPHITVGRIREPAVNLNLKRLLEGKSDKVWGELPVHRVVLYRSDLTPAGPIYRVLSILQLGTHP